ncbi:uncharacterized protein LOC120625116 isoform X1 [Pararge aegeria]|uniref:uncharacterized protein LOC120625116 isoform X1 n=1 Tax=Pararge aegeria TaxID=116150 RepID=UPI0019D2C629|nr:uncharacterized protein LOC120625116 isoform X1 [Pararge aegeria]
MARDVHLQWDDEDRYTTDRDSDDSPILNYRYDKHRRYEYNIREIKPERERRWAVTLAAKCSLFSTAMILFCVLLYIPVYNRANDQLPKELIDVHAPLKTVELKHVPAPWVTPEIKDLMSKRNTAEIAVAGWSVHTNRDTKIYVQPDNVTTVHEPKYICPKATRSKTNNLFLLIVVCSSTSNFEKRVAIRETWGSYKNYLKSGKIFHLIREKYEKYNYTYDLYRESINPRLNVNLSVNKLVRRKRDISVIGRVLPELAKALQSNLANGDNEVQEKRFEDEKEEEAMPEFDMEKELNENEDLNMDYDYPSNVMKIPPKGYEDNPDLDEVLSMLKKSKDFPKEEILEEETGSTVDFKLVFLLGLPSQENDTSIQDKIEEEVEKYGDVIQEGFVDSYNNLTLKSIMMLKWVTNNCNESVRYFLKTDDDVYVNVPNLVLNLQNRSQVHDSTKGQEKEYLLIGDLICGARPVQDVSNKWYSPRYMYGGRVYPRYLSGTGYVLSSHTAMALYEAALRTSYFHLEDIYITGMCAVRAKPRIVPRDEPGFSYTAVGNNACAAHSHLTAHRVEPAHMRHIATRLADTRIVDKCERIRLTQVKKTQSRMYVIYKYLQLLVSNVC